MTRDRPIVVACASDIHANSSVGLCPPEGVTLDDGGQYLPNELQEWLWRGWAGFWRRVDQVRQALGAELVVILDGDMVEGAHHGTTQIVTGNLEVQHRLAMSCLALPASLHPARWFLVRGTEVHVGHAAQHEEAIGRELGATVDPENGRSSWWHLRAEINGTRLDVAHHGRVGQRPWTTGNGAVNQAASIMMESVRTGYPVPHLAIRAHRHRFADSGVTYPVRLVQLPCWQMSTGYGHKVAPDSLPDVGGLIVTCNVGGGYQLEPWLHRPEPPAIWRETP